MGVGYEASSKWLNFYLNLISLVGRAVGKIGKSKNIYSKNNKLWIIYGGGGGIRTHGTR